jgi:Alpha-2-macroglobulin family
VIDKSFSTFRPGNDIRRSDVYEDYSTLRRSKGELDLPGSVILYDNLTSWRICSNEELSELEREIDLIEESNEVKEDSLVSSYTWIFETINLPSSGSITIPLTTPNTITTWSLSAISLSSDLGIAISDPQELVVSKDFFVKLNLPYSIYKGEVYKLDVLIFNNLPTTEVMSVEVTLYSENFEFVEMNKIQDGCQLTFSNFSSKTIKSQVASSVSSASFHIRSMHPEIINLRLSASATTPSSGKFKDEIVETLRVETEGVTMYDNQITIINFESFLREQINFKFSSMNVHQSLVRFSATISSDLMENSIGYDAQSL